MSKYTPIPTRDEWLNKAIPLLTKQTEIQHLMDGRGERLTLASREILLKALPESYVHLAPISDPEYAMMAGNEDQMNPVVIWWKTEKLDAVTFVPKKPWHKRLTLDSWWSVAASAVFLAGGMYVFVQTIANMNIPS